MSDVCYGICIRLDLAHAINVVSKYMANSGRQHWGAIKWIFRYMKGTTEYDIAFVRQKSDFSVLGYVDADFEEDLDERRSSTGYYVFILVRGPICWTCMVQISPWL